MNNMSKVTLGLIVSTFVLSPLTYADENTPVEATKMEIKAKKEEIKQERAELKKDRAEKRELVRKLRAERRAARKAKKELKKDAVAQPVSGEGQPVETQPAQQ